MRSAIKVAAEAIDVARPRSDGIVILIYHRVGGATASEIDLPAPRFEEQMVELSAAGQTRTLDRAVESLASPQPPNADPVVVTFDDGTADFMDEAVPVLARHGVPATLYVATRHVEDQVPFPGGGKPLSWAALRDAVSTGLVTVGSHTHSHRLLDRAAPDEVVEELDRSIDLIEDRLGVPAEHFAYPKAVPGSDDADAAVRARFRSAALAGTRPNRYGRTDVHQLARSPIQMSDGMRWFRRKVAGGMALEDGLRRLVNRGRYAGATS